MDGFADLNHRQETRRTPGQEGRTAPAGARGVGRARGALLRDHGSIALEQAIQKAYVQGALVVIAAGNAGTDNDDFPPVPACYPDGRQKGVITVMATNRCGEKASFSNYGRKTVDLAAPGGGIVTTRAALASAAGDETRLFPIAAPRRPPPTSVGRRRCSNCCTPTGGPGNSRNAWSNRSSPSRA